jgi:hypothetical protein
MKRLIRILLFIVLLYITTIDSVLPQYIINSKSKSYFIRDVQTFQESVEFEDDTVSAIRVCVRFDQPTYVVEETNRLIQIHRVRDVVLDGAAVVRCTSQNHVLYPVTRNVSRPVVSLFKTMNDNCPPGTQYNALIFDVSPHENMTSCKISFDSDILVNSNREIVRDEALLPPRPYSSRNAFVYQYEPTKECSTKENYITTLVELDTMASSHGLLTGTQALKVGIFKMIFEPVLKTAMKPVMNAIVNSFTPELDALFEILEADVKEQAPGDIGEVVAAKVSATLTNLLIDGISSRLVSQVSDSLAEDLGLYLQSTISEAVVPKLVSSLMKSLSSSVPETLNRVFPDLLVRSILPPVTDTLTRSITHSLTHTISISLGGGKQQHEEEFCRLCYNSGTHCGECHNSASSVYYTSYYATYYSDFYSEYYAKYYTDAIRFVDKKTHPLSYDGDNSKKL